MDPKPPEKTSALSLPHTIREECVGTAPNRWKRQDPGELGPCVLALYSCISSKPGLLSSSPQHCPICSSYTWLKSPFSGNPLQINISPNATLICALSAQVSLLCTLICTLSAALWNLGWCPGDWKLQGPLVWLCSWPWKVVEGGVHLWEMACRTWKHLFLRNTVHFPLFILKSSIQRKSWICPHVWVFCSPAALGQNEFWREAHELFLWTLKIGAMI